MADLPDVSGVDPNAGVYPVLPAGQYPIEVYDSEKKVTNAGTGEYLRLYIQTIKDGTKLQPCDLNLWNNNETTTRIAQQHLAQICHSTNTIGARDSAAFHNKAMIAEIAIQPAEGQYPAKNIYRRFLPINGEARSNNAARHDAGQQHPDAQPQPTTTARGNAPWRR